MKFVFRTLKQSSILYRLELISSISLIDEPENCLFENEDGEYFDKVTEEEFDRIYSYLRQINMTERYQKQICVDKFLFYKTNYLYNLNQHITAIEILIELNLIK